MIEVSKPLIATTQDSHFPIWGFDLRSQFNDPPNAKPESEGSDSGFPFEQLVVTTNPVTQGLLRWAIVKRLEANLFLLRSVIIFSEGLFYDPSLIGNAKRLK